MTSQIDDIQPNYCDELMASGKIVSSRVADKLRTNTRNTTKELQRFQQNMLRLMLEDDNK